MATVRGGLLTALIPLLALGATFSWSPRSPSEARNLVAPTAGGEPSSVAISQTGELKALEFVTLVAPASSGARVAYLAPEGSLVKPGDTLVRLAPGQLEPSLDAARATLEASRSVLERAGEDRDAERETRAADLSRLEAEVRLAELDLTKLTQGPRAVELEAAQTEVQRAERDLESADRRRQVLLELVRTGFVTRAVLDAAEPGYAAATARLQAARSALERLTAGPPPEDLERGERRLERAKQELKEAQASQLRSFAGPVDRQHPSVVKATPRVEPVQKWVEQTALRAPRGGLVVHARAVGETGADTLRVGMIPVAGQPLIHLVDVATVVAAVEIDEIDVARLRIGAPAAIRLAAYPDTVFPARVHHIAVPARLRRDGTGGVSATRVFEVAVKVEARDPRLKLGSTATVDIAVDSRVDSVAPFAGSASLTDAFPDSPYLYRGNSPQLTVTSASDAVRSGRALATYIKEVATRYGVAERLVSAVIQVESGFNPRAVSPRGARGLMQLMPATAVILGVNDSFDPAENIDGGVRHLRGLLDRFGNDLALALAAYNAGEQAVMQHGGIPPYPETQEYVARILRLVGGTPPSRLR